jgi:hypothetical protein
MIRAILAKAGIGAVIAIGDAGKTSDLFLDYGIGKGLIASIDKNGMVEFAVEAGLGSPVSGSQMFKEMMEHFGSNVKSIKGNWTYGDNLATVNNLTKIGMPLENAVLETWTGKQAALYGYTKASVSLQVILRCVCKGLATQRISRQQSVYLTVFLFQSV